MEVVLSLLAHLYFILCLPIVVHSLRRIDQVRIAVQQQIENDDGFSSKHQQDCPVKTSGSSISIMHDGSSDGCREEEKSSEIMEFSDPWTLKEGIVDSEHGTLIDLFSALNCHETLSIPRPIPNQTSWVLLRAAYQATVGPKNSTIDGENIYGSSSLVPVFASTSQEDGLGGRGLYAQQDIPKGTKIGRVRYQAQFARAAFYRRFLASIPKDLACDVMIWTYLEFEDYDDPNTPLAIKVDFDVFALINHDPLRKNMNNEYLALRDINAGEEILEDYGDYEYDEKWEQFGL